MYGIQTSSLLQPTRPQPTETPAASTRADASGGATAASAVVAPGPAASELNTARLKADALSQSNQEVRRAVEGQGGYESRLADRRWAAAVSGGEQPSAESVRIQRGAQQATLDEARDMQTLNVQQFVGSLNGVAQSAYSMSPEQKQRLSAELESLFAAASPTAREAAAPILYSAKGAANGMISDRELWALIGGSISDIKDGYLGVYENVVGKYIAFYQDFSAILTKMAGWVSSNDKGDKVTLSVGQLYQELDALMKKYGTGVLHPASGTVSKAEAEQKAKDLGLPESCVQQQGSGYVVVGNGVLHPASGTVSKAEADKWVADLGSGAVAQEKPAGSGKYVVVIDNGPLQKMMDALNKLAGGVPASDKKVEMNNAEYQSWQSGFKAQEENLKNTLQTLTQKLSNANSLFDNLVKVLSSTISSCTETAKSFLQG
ncbi:hypothetical protein CXB49_11125 [Chromobacterium sp. ATCC 53434]|uniref:IpaD/SipD/SspD family type III secretion system needle tip protein n=1 Tax=Chromobacterium sp. (strain ATCC 53434 / SC 14030) TaxID=2059672 RepID=UPI000C76C663|nr:IpaD/SipD/SspD family type III secretion system needle tip protein [Chromobacterium sp. ATCC 53434]AUH51327.1 hypothetical protein CXB49_11125 [Chromobacterium sp. ATCC 53434]